MLEFYRWHELPRLLLTLLNAVVVLLQALTVVVSFSRRRTGKIWFLENFLECAILLHLMVLSLLHGQIVHNAATGLIAPTSYGLLRILATLVVFIFSLWVFSSTKRAMALWAGCFAILTLPQTEDLFSHLFPIAFLIAIICLGVRAAHVAYVRAGLIRTGLSALSIKNTIDQLHSGILFSEPDGFILLTNVRMQQLMKTITGEVMRDGAAFYRALLHGELCGGCERTWSEGQIVFRLPDQTVWVFNSSELKYKNKQYAQLVATDITQRWSLTDRLRKQEDALIEKGRELSEAIEDLSFLIREQETEKAKRRAHDVLGQRLSFLLRTIRSGDQLDYGLLRSLSEGLLDDMKEEDANASPSEELRDLRKTLGAIGVTLDVSGALPVNAEHAAVLIKIIREAMTNAVRHGFATVISVDMVDQGAWHYLTVTNNGQLPNRPIVEGGGISGMRQRLKAYDGTLEVWYDTQFVLRVGLPGGS